MSQTFTVVNDDVLADEINKAATKIIYIAPGVSKAVALALGNRFGSLGSLSITIIVDNDPEVYRLGYGDTEGLDHIKKLSDEHMLELRQQPGVRIGVLITDETTLVYSPTPHLIEAGSDQEDKPNAIVIPTATDAIEKACATTSGTLPEDAEIGRSVVRVEALSAMKKDLEEVPPKQYSVARIERVFNSRIQYVEFKLNKYKLSSMIAPISSDLMGLQDNEEIRNRWRNAFKMFDSADSLKVDIPARGETGEIKLTEEGGEITVQYDEVTIQRDRKRIEEDFLYKIPNYDVVIFRSRRAAFDRAIEIFNMKLADYHDALKQQIKDSIGTTIAKLVTVLLPLVRNNIPARYLKSSFTPDKISDEDLATMLTEDLKSHFGNVEEISLPVIKLKYKDVSYETIHDPGFRAALELSKIPKNRVRELFSEHDAAPETSGELF
ncbi:MAG: hypothetical protein AB2604_12165 [Candidatus Thiodiazotropha taylori]